VAPWNADFLVQMEQSKGDRTNAIEGRYMNGLKRLRIEPYTKVGGQRVLSDRAEKGGA